MPEKIQPASAQSLFDIIFPKEARTNANLSDGEASFLYTLWKSAPTGATSFQVPPNADRKHVTALKTKGYLSGFGEGIELTDQGKKIIVEMVTHEPNSFEKHAQDVSYSGIKAKSANSRPRQAFLKKQASSTGPVKSFNLHRESLKRLAGE